MPRGDKSKYTDKQKRKAEHIAEATRIAAFPRRKPRRGPWATVNKDSGGGNKSGSGRGHAETHASARKGGEKGGKASPRARPPAVRIGQEGGCHSQAECRGGRGARLIHPNVPAKQRALDPGFSALS